MLNEEIFKDFIRRIKAWLLRHDSEIEELKERVARLEQESPTNPWKLPFD